MVDLVGDSVWDLKVLINSRKKEETNSKKRPADSSTPSKSKKAKKAQKNDDDVMDEEDDATPTPFNFDPPALPPNALVRGASLFATSPLVPTMSQVLQPAAPSLFNFVASNPSPSSLFLNTPQGAATSSPIFPNLFQGAVQPAAPSLFNFGASNPSPFSMPQANPNSQLLLEQFLQSLNGTPANAFAPIPAPSQPIQDLSKSSNSNDGNDTDNNEEERDNEEEQDDEEPEE
jgi:hypothetical protein